MNRPTKRFVFFQELFISFLHRGHKGLTNLHEFE